MVVTGIARVQVDKRFYVLKEGQTIKIPKNTRHRIEAKETKCVILEISYGEFDEDDIVRLDDDYKRKTTSPSTRKHEKFVSTKPNIPND